jgi:hypothetical protein
MGAAGVTVATTNQRIEADALRQTLESAGVQAWLADDGVVGANPLLAIAVGGVKVQVDPADVERAREVLARLRMPRLADDGTDRCLSCGTPMGEADERCARCGWTYKAG